MDKVNYFHVYIKTDCGFCRKAIDLLDKKKEEFVVTVLDKSKEYELLIKEECSWQTVPIVIYCEVEDREEPKKDVKLIGGFTELEQYFNQKKTTGVLSD